MAGKERKQLTINSEQLTINGERVRCRGDADGHDLPHEERFSFRLPRPLARIVGFVCGRGDGVWIMGVCGR